MELTDLGYNSDFESFRAGNNLSNFEVARVIAEYKERYIVKTAIGEFDAEITGNMRFTATTREDFPAVGDWVSLAIYESDFAIIHSIFPRFSVIKRQSISQIGEVQVIAANIDFALLLQALDRDFNINRLERYLTICHSSKVKPIIVLTKADLIDDQRILEIKGGLKQRVENIPVIAISNQTQSGYDELLRFIEKGKTYCLLGSSGVGKSTLLNNLSGQTVMKTDAISQSTHKGRHITSHRELIILESGGLLIDNPGMREVGIADSGDGLETTFDKIINLSNSCKYKDCTHTNEIGCSVIVAVEKGELDRSSYENYLKMEREKAHFEKSIAEKRKKEKVFGRILKDYHKKNVKDKNF